MRRSRLAHLAAALLLATLLATPAGVLAADTVTVTGTVVRDGQPMSGVAVVVTVAGSDVIASATTDDGGSFAVEVEGGIGSEVRVNATGQEFRSEPDGKGCVHSETPIGSATLTVDAIPLAPVQVVLDQLRTFTACSATGTPRITPPSTDAHVTPRPASTSGGGLLLVLGVLALAGAGSLALATRRA